MEYRRTGNKWNIKIDNFWRHKDQIKLRLSCALTDFEGNLFWRQSFSLKEWKAMPGQQNAHCWAVIKVPGVEFKILTWTSSHNMAFKI